MTSLINDNELLRLVNATLTEDLNEALDKATDEVLAKMKDRIRHHIASRMIAIAKSDYNMEYHQGRLQIQVRIQDEDKTS